MLDVAQQVQVTNTINITLILSVISAIGIAGGFFVAMFFKLVRAVMKEIFETRIEMLKQTQRITDLQTARLESCIHRIPGHPENPFGQLAPVEEVTPDEKI